MRMSYPKEMISLDLKFMMMMVSLVVMHQMNQLVSDIFHWRIWVRFTFYLMVFIISFSFIEQSYLSRLPLQINDKRWNNKSGNLIITEYKKAEAVRKTSSYSSNHTNVPAQTFMQTTTPAPVYQLPYPPPASSSRKYSGGGFVLPGRN